ncbi:unnamed protein product [Microthlaspi erraticum]|uniref:Uncharacterized protein n=1 Tax=Microthlaspi erraticum TaxID=1685480 RepID=A0A6D2K2F5_9BRAS|nr:unnamed protein product [Microthlaspi erraticum]CAA7036220.1 unnamed protein product [Microthlaspi erraticum]CAA7046432.1 unnamed protein product [Microthlaspi erraticum]
MYQMHCYSARCTELLICLRRSSFILTIRMSQIHMHSYCAGCIRCTLTVLDISLQTRHFFRPDAPPRAKRFLPFEKQMLPPEPHAQCGTKMLSLEPNVLSDFRNSDAEPDILTRDGCFFQSQLFLLKPYASFNVRRSFQSHMLLLKPDIPSGARCFL